MKIFLLDNYDSFTYNLVHYLERSGKASVTVGRNDKIYLDSISQFDRIVLSPGPGLPSQSGLLLDVIKKFASVKPILGVCLGLQAIAEVYGARLFNLEKVHHGVARTLFVKQADCLYQGLPDKFMVGRYHSWVMDKSFVPECLEVTGFDEDGEIMSFRHRTLNIRAVQYHPESILTENGQQIIDNWLNLA